MLLIEETQEKYNYCYTIQIMDYHNIICRIQDFYALLTFGHVYKGPEAEHGGQ